MNDTITAKPLVASSFDADNFGTGRDFPRVASSDKEAHVRRNDSLGSTSPTLLSVKHSQSKAVHRATVILEQRYARTDAQSNVLRTDFATLGFTGNVPDNVTETEFITQLQLLTGILLESDCAVARSLYRGEY